MYGSIGSGYKMPIYRKTVYCQRSQASPIPYIIRKVLRREETRSNGHHHHHHHHRDFLVWPK